MMKKLHLLLITMILSNLLLAQVPLGHYAIFDFTGGSLTNSSTSSNFSGSALSTTDRFGTAGNAIITSGNLTGVNLGATNFNNSTLSFWIKTGPLTTTKRIIQMYGTGSHGFRVEIDGSNVTVNCQVMASTSIGQSYTGAYNLDDNTWHHIAVRTTSIVNNTQLKVELFIDGAITTTGGDVDPPGIYINDFLENANLIVDPLNSYNASIDDIFMYKSSLSDAEVAQLFNLSAPVSRSYVDIDATGNNDGTSWTDAYTDLRSAFINSTAGVEIWVADGKYIRQNITDRNAVFGWTSDYVKVYGGFNGSETLLSERDWRTNRTIMSGDIGTAGDNGDNCYTVLAGPYGTSANPINHALVDGFVIQDGNANLSATSVGQYGGGFYFQSYVKEMEIRNCEFIENVADQGGGMYVNSTSTSDAKLILDACIFSNNESRFGSGVLFVTNGADLEVDMSNCLFHNNETKNIGNAVGGNGVVYIQEQNHNDIDVSISNTTIANNQNNGTSTTNNYYGSVMVYKNNGSSGTGNVKMDNCVIWGNDGDLKTVVRHTGGQNLNSVIINNTISQYTFPVTLGNLTQSNIIYQNPMFTDSANNVFTLSSNSPAVDAGIQTGLTISALDLAGNARVNGPEIDLGCYEQHCNIPAIQITESEGVLSAPTSFVSYQWSLDGTDISGATSSTFTPTNSGLYSLAVSDGSCSKSIPVFFCSSTLVTVYENNGVLTAPSGFTSYEWFLDGVVITGASNAVYATTQDGEFYCEATLIIPNSTSICTQASNTVSICSTVSVSITESNGLLTATPGYTDYQWFQNGLVITGAMNDTYTATEGGNFYCNATENGCTASSNIITIDLSTAIQNVSFEKVKVYPNPTNGIITLQVEEMLTSVRLLDLSGRTIQVFNPENKQLNISRFITGIYFLEIANAEKKSVVKIIKK